MDDKIHSLLKSLISAPGLSGHEKPVRKLLEDAWQLLVDELSVSRLGSLHGLKRGRVGDRSLLLAAHMDAIGLMVTGVQGEFLRLAEIGGVDARVLPGQLVTVHGRQDLPGVVVQPPGHLLPAGTQDGAPELRYLLVDTGHTSRELSSLARPGDLVSFAQAPIEMNNELLVGHSLDNRASVAAVTCCLEQLQSRLHDWNVWAVATVQEEETLGGAATSAFELKPTLAVAIDVTFGSSSGSPSHKTFPLGKGPTLGWGPNIHPAIFEAFRDLADRLEIPYTVEVMPRHSGTDAIAMQVVEQGIPNMVLSIPLRYMHTPVEMVAMKDILRAGRLLAEFAASLDAGFLEKITWKD
jgi:putative aminopeptidase FrvX